MTPLEAVKVINEHLGIGGAITHPGNELKCYVREEDGSGPYKRYFGSSECAALQDAFATLADALRSG